MPSSPLRAFALVALLTSIACADPVASHPKDGSISDAVVPTDSSSPSDPCARANGGCDPLTTCTSVGEVTTCGPCPTGYTGSGPVGCVDVDECLVNNGGCDPLATCTNVVGGRTCGACPPGYTGTGATGCTPIPCNDGSDPLGDTMTATFDVNRAQIPGATEPIDGLDVDGVTSIDATTAAGCFMADSNPPGAAAQNVDNKFSGIASWAGAVNIDLGGAIQNAFVGASRTTSLGVRLRQWNGSKDDACVIVDLLVGTGPTLANPVVVGTKASSLAAGVSPTIAGWPDLAFTTHVTRSGCSGVGSTTSGCSTPITCASDAPVTVGGVKLRLHLEPATGGGFQLVTNRPRDTSATVAMPTLLGGFVYMITSDGGPANCGNLGVGTFGATLQTVACQLGLGSQFSYACDVALNALDLHSSAGAGSGRTLDACTGTSRSNGNQNSGSLGLYLGSGY